MINFLRAANLCQKIHRKLKPAVVMAAVQDSCEYFLGDVGIEAFRSRINDVGAQVLLGASLMMGATAGAQATTIINDNVYQTPFISLNNYYDGLYADRLTEWLGKGSLTLTSIFDQVTYDDQHYLDTGRSVLPSEIDAAVAGKGPTFTILYASNNKVNSNLIGWYNPINGVTAVGGNADETSNDSFIFNLTTDRVLRPVNDPVVSNIKAGRDLSLNENFPAYGNIRINSYVDSFQGKGVLWDPAFSYSSSGTGEFTYYFLEVYSISVDALAPVSAVPEPASWALTLAGLGIVGALHRRRRSAPAALA